MSEVQGAEVTGDQSMGDGRVMEIRQGSAGWSVREAGVENCKEKVKKTGETGLYCRLSK